MKRIAAVAMFVGALVLAGCVPLPAPATAPPKSKLDMINPAAKYCTDQGYKWEVRTQAGGEAGTCRFPDGSECDEWAYYRGQCGPGGAKTGAGLPNPASQFCIAKGGKLEIRSAAGGQAGFCLFSDGSECDEWAFFRGDCAPKSK